ncbi:hypothetical protein [Pseudomonas sp. B26(2017)]|uniref:hypothetical protein n=1 Tax=Pseudomonas sp. B26(2017) TaxID=1981732 RepID=UPI000A1FFA97|nr:hypothetical protein [Pseudomonas sp. B26(2017)]
MKKTLALLAVSTGLLLSGCAGIEPGAGFEPGAIWKAAQTTDEFTDGTTSFVTTGEFRSNTSIFTRGMHLYPVVRKEGNQLYVGVMSGGRFKIPVGTVQLRIDQNEAWTITPQETPIAMVPPAPNFVPPNLPPDQAAIIKSAQEQAMLSTTQMMSPYTVTGGEKAKTIIKQMLSGHIIKYRTVGINQAASTTGEAVIDKSFADALQKIGVNPREL